MFFLPQPPLAVGAFLIIFSKENIDKLYIFAYI